MRCPSCGLTVSTYVEDNILNWRCVDGCGATGNTPLAQTRLDTQIDMYHERKLGTGQFDPLLDDEPPF